MHLLLSDAYPVLCIPETLLSDSRSYIESCYTFGNNYYLLVRRKSSLSQSSRTVSPFLPIRDMESGARVSPSPSRFKPTQPKIERQGEALPRVFGPLPPGGGANLTT